MFSPYSTPAANLQTPYRTITITTNLPPHLSTPSTDPTLMLVSPHPQTPCWGLKPVHRGSLSAISRVRRGRTSFPPTSPRAGSGGESQPRPPATPSLLGLPGRLGRARQALRRPPAAPQFLVSAATPGQAEPQDPRRRAHTHCPGAGSPRRPRGHPLTPRLGQVPGPPRGHSPSSRCS